jgi:hypothetical protein
MRRLLGTMACLALVATLVSPALCFMPAAASPDSPNHSEHDCCRSGLQSTPPACCMSSMATDAAGRIPAKLVVEPAVASPMLFVPAPVCDAQRVTPSAFLGAPHLKTSPVRVLRI